MKQSKVEIMNQRKVIIKLQQEQIAERNLKASDVHKQNCEQKTIQNLTKEIDEILHCDVDGYGPIMHKVLERYEQKYKHNVIKQMDEEERDFWIAVKIRCPEVYDMLRPQFCLSHKKTVDKQKYDKLKEFKINTSILGEEYKTDHSYLGRLAETYGANSDHPVYGGVSTDFCAFNLHSYMNGGKIKNFVKVKYGKYKGQLRPVSHMVSFVFTPTDRSLPKATIFCQKRAKGNGDREQLALLYKIKQDLEQHSIRTRWFSLDGDHFFDKYKSKQFDWVHKQSKDRTKSCYEYLVPNKEHMWSPDWTHLQKLSRYNFTKKRLSLAFSPNKGVIDKEIIQEIIDEMDQNAFRDGQQFKLRDDLSLKLNCSRNISRLFEKPETIHSAIYFMLNFALSQMYVKMTSMSFQRLLILDLFIMIQLYDRAKIEYRTADKKRISMTDQSRSTMLTAFNFTWMKQYIVTLQKALQTLHQYKTIGCYSMSSMPSEHLYSALRTHSHFQNDINMAEVVLNNQRLLELIEYQHKFKINNDGNRVSSHKTTSYSTNEFVELPEQTALWNLAEDTIKLIFWNKRKTTQADQDKYLEMYNKLKQFWDDIENTIETEHYDTLKDQRINEGFYVTNNQQQSSQARIRSQPVQKEKIVKYIIHKKPKKKTK
ncbi:Conserved_hypothetical protein [Hexamita inflata]|uniref:Transposase n=1 Tax=Hexamita inflata TaxID=28002 RepID=A0AA86V121_9EUKA|nr:Conserved hypothetical protein [Hexamita inflata]